MSEPKWDKIEHEWGHFYRLKSAYKSQDSYWFIGMDDENGIEVNRKIFDLNKDNKDFILKYWEFKKDKPPAHKPKAQRNSTEYNFLIEGKIIGKVDKEKLTLTQGDFVIIRPGFVINLQEEILEDARGITVKIPGIKKDEIYKDDFLN